MITINLLGEGQSNPMQTGPAYQATKFPPAVKMWNNGQQASNATDNLGNAWVDPGTLPYGNTMFAHMARRIHEVLGLGINLLANMRGATAITAWSEANHNVPVGPQYPAHPYYLHHRLTNLMTTTGITHFHGFGHHQGESDRNAEHYYFKRWWGRYHLLRAQNIIDANTPVVIGEVAALGIHTKLLAVQRAIPFYDPHVVGIASLASLPTVNPLSTPQSPHFTAEAIVIAGIRMADVMIPRLQGLIARGIISE